MTDERLIELARRSEAEAQKNPKGYQARVAVLAALGYAYLFLVLALLVGFVLFVLFVFGMDFTPLPVLGVTLALALLFALTLWGRIPPPEEIPLRPEEAPALFALVEEQADHLQSPRFHRIHLTEEFNAAVIQVPRFGLFGGHHNYLLLGLPYLTGVSPRQFEATLAHELGHMSKNHSRFAGRIYRLRHAWERVLDEIDKTDGIIDFTFQVFYGWYIPYFNARSFALARQHEYEADRVASELTDAPTNAASLVTASVKARYFAEDLLPEVVARAAESVEPPSDLFDDIARKMKAPVPEGPARSWLLREFREQTDYSDTHPSLSDRLAAMGQLPGGSPEEIATAWPAPEPLPESAADIYLGEGLALLSRRMSEAWKERVAEDWKERHQRLRETRVRLAVLERRAEERPLSPDDAWDRAEVIFDLKGMRDALPLYRELLDRCPDHAGACFRIGSYLLQEGDESGIDLLERGIRRDAGYVTEGCLIIYAYLTERRRFDEAERYFRRAEQRQMLDCEAEQERCNVSFQDQFLPHGLPETTLQRLRDRFRQETTLKEAYLVRKEVRHDSHRPLYVLGLVPGRAGLYRDRPEDLTLRDRIVEVLDEELQDDYIVIPLVGENREFLSYRSFQNARIFPDAGE